MKTYIKKYSRNSLIISTLLIILSFFLIINPFRSLQILSIIFGIILLIDATIHIISYFKSPNEFRTFNFEFIVGIIEILISLILFVYPNWISIVFSIFIGIWIIISSIIKIQISINIRNIKGVKWLVLLIFGIITLLFGLVVIFNPFSSAIALTTLWGVIIFITELINIIEYIFILVKLKN